MLKWQRVRWLACMGATVWTLAIVSAVVCYGQATYTITHEPNQQTVQVGETFTINVIYHANLADTTVFSRMAIDYDSTVVRCIAITNGTDVPAGAYAQPFINWGPVCFQAVPLLPRVDYGAEKGTLAWARQQAFLDGTAACEPPFTDWVAQHVYLGQFFEIGCSNAGQPIPWGVSCEQWSGHAITYTFLAVGEGTTGIWYPERGYRMNYVDQAPWVCSGNYVAEYTSDEATLQTCIGLLHLPQDSSVTVSGIIAVGVDSYRWGTVKRLFQ